MPTMGPPDVPVATPQPIGTPGVPPPQLTPLPTPSPPPPPVPAPTDGVVTPVEATPVPQREPHKLDLKAKAQIDLAPVIVGNAIDKDRVKAGQKLNVRLMVNVITPTSNLTVAVKLPVGLDYDEKSSKLAEYNATTRELIWHNVDASVVTTGDKKAAKSARYDDYRLIVTAAATPADLLLTVGISTGQVDCCLALTTQVQVGSQKPNADIDDKAGGTFKLDDRVELTFAPSAVKQKTKINGVSYKARAASKEAPVGLHVAFDLFPDMRFDAPVTATVDLNGLLADDSLSIATENGWFPTLIYLRPETVTQTATTDAGTQVFTYTTFIQEPIASTFDPETNKLTAQLAHFSSYMVSFSQPKPEAWKLSANGGNVSLFRGAATFAYPVAVPGMVDGLQPNLALQYSSASADSGANGSAPGVGILVGKGWSLDLPRITRVVKREQAMKPWGHPIGPDAGTIWGNCNWNNPNFHTSCFVYLRTRYVNDFSLTMGGQTYHLVPKFDVNAQTGGEYVTESFSPLRVVRCNTQFTCSNVNGQNLAVAGAGNAAEYWQVWTPDGTRWLFGIDATSTNIVSHQNDKDDTTYNAAAAMGTQDSNWLASYNATNAFNSARAMYAGGTNGQITRIWFLRRVYAANRDDINTANRWSVEWNYTDQGYNGGADEIKRCVANNPNACFTGNDPLVRPVSVTYGPSLKPNNTAATQRYRVVFNPAWGTRLGSLETQVVNTSGTVLQYLRKTVVNVNEGCTDSALFSIDEQVRSGNTWVNGLPLTSFTYADYAHNNGQTCLLKKIINGYGGEWEYTYEGNATWNSYWVTQQVVRSGMTGSVPMTTTYSYSKPANNQDENYADWCIQLSGKPCINAAYVFWGDWPNNLAGFKTATATSQNTNGATLVQAVQTFVHNDYKRLGQTTETRSWGYDYTNTWKVMQASSTTYADLAYYGSNSYTSGKVWHYQPTSSYHYVNGDVGSSPYAQTDLQYDSYGHVTRRIERGFNTVTGDERTSVMGYYPNTTDWIVSKLAYENIYANASTSGFPANDFLTQSRLYYDNNTSVSSSPTKGQLKKVDSGASQATVNYAFLLIAQTITYDSAGNISTITDPRNFVSTATYDDNGWFLKQVQNAAGHTIKYAYYGVNESDCSLSGGSGLYGAAKCAVDPNLQPTGYAYDGFGRLVSVVRPGDSFSVPTVSYEYYDNISSGGLRGLRVIEWQLEVQGNASYRQPRVSYYDGLGRAQQTRVEQTDGMAMTVSSVGYDALSRAAQQSVPTIANASSWADPATFWGYQAPNWANPKTTTTFDGLGRALTITGPDGNTSSTSYDGLGGYARTVSTNPRGVQRQSHADGLGRTTHVQECHDDNMDNGVQCTWHSTFYEYDGLGNLKKVRDAANNETTLKYDALSRKIDMVDPDMGHWTYAYDANGNLTSQTDAKNQTLTFEYDEVNRLRWKAYPNGDGFYHMFDEAGQSHAKGRRTYTHAYVNGAWTNNWTRWYYDTRGRMTSEVKSIDGTAYDTTYEYDSADRVTRMRYPDMEWVNTSYNAAWQPDSMAGTNPYVNGTSYNALGQVTDLRLSNNQSQRYYYFGSNLNAPINPGGQPNYRYGRLRQTCVLATATGAAGECADGGVPGRAATGSTALNMYYDYDAIGNISATYDQLGATGLGYKHDSLDRLTSVSGGFAESYAYNAIGNMTNKSNVGNYDYAGWSNNGVSTCANKADSAVTSRAHAVGIAGGNGYCYDANGNNSWRWEQGTLYRQHWNADNKLVKIDKHTPSGSWPYEQTLAQFSYDADGMRVKSVTNGLKTEYAGNHYEVKDTPNNWVNVTFAKTVGVSVSGNTLQRNDGQNNWGGAGASSTAYCTGGFCAAYTTADTTSGHRMYGLSNTDTNANYNSIRYGLYLSNAGVLQIYEGGVFKANVGSYGVGDQFSVQAEGDNVVRYYRLPAGSSSWQLLYASADVPTYPLRMDSALYENGSRLAGMLMYGAQLKTPTSYYFFGSQRVAMRTPTDGVQWLHSDHLGSASLATNASGGVVPNSEQRYTPFGSPRLNASGLQNKFTFTGQRSFMDEVGLMDYNARMYSPLIGRFISADTIVPGAGNPQNFNRYSYVLNRPLNMVDPSGHCGDEATQQETDDCWSAYNAATSSEYFSSGVPDGLDKWHIGELTNLLSWLQAGVRFFSGTENWTADGIGVVIRGLDMVRNVLGGRTNRFLGLGGGGTLAFVNNSNLPGEAYGYGRGTLATAHGTRVQIYKGGMSTETVVHELGHIVDYQLGGEDDRRGWNMASALGPYSGARHKSEFEAWFHGDIAVSDYGRDKGLYEDFAETFAWTIYSYNGEAYRSACCAQTRTPDVQRQIALLVTLNQ